MTEKEYRGLPEKKDIEGVAKNITTDESAKPYDYCLHNCSCDCPKPTNCGQICNASCKSGKTGALMIDFGAVGEDLTNLESVQMMKDQLGDIHIIIKTIKK